MASMGGKWKLSLEVRPQQSHMSATGSEQDRGRILVVSTIQEGPKTAGRWVFSDNIPVLVVQPTVDLSRDCEFSPAPLHQEIV